MHKQADNIHTLFTIVESNDTNRNNRTRTSPPRTRRAQSEVRRLQPSTVRHGPLLDHIRNSFQAMDLSISRTQREFIDSAERIFQAAFPSLSSTTTTATAQQSTSPIINQNSPITQSVFSTEFRPNFQSREDDTDRRMVFDEEMMNWRIRLEKSRRDRQLRQHDDTPSNDALISYGAKASNTLLSDISGVRKTFYFFFKLPYWPI